MELTFKFRTSMYFAAYILSVTNKFSLVLDRVKYELQTHEVPIISIRLFQSAQPELKIHKTEMFKIKFVKGTNLCET